MRNSYPQIHLLIGALIFTLTPLSTTAQSEDGSLMTARNESPASELLPRFKEYQYLVDSDEDAAQVSHDMDVLENYVVLEERPTSSSSISAEYWRDLDVVFKSPTPVSDAADHCGMLITPAPILMARQDDNGELAALSNSAAAASRSASAGIQNAQVSASNAIAAAGRDATQSISDASRSLSSISSSASSALSSMSSQLSSIQSSASSAVSQANSSASSAMMEASVLVQAASGSVNAAGTSFLAAAAKATSNAQESILAIGAAATQLVTQSQAQAKASQALAISSTNAAIAIVASIIGSAIITFLVFFFVIRYRQKRQTESERGKYTGDHNPRSGRAAYRDSRSDAGSIRSYYKDEKRPISVERSRSRSRHRRDLEREGRRDRRDSAGESERPSRYEKESSNSKTRVGSAPSISTYSAFPRGDYSPKRLTRAIPQTLQNPQTKLYNPDPVDYPKEPDKVARKPTNVDTPRARKELVSVATSTSSTANNLSTWLRDQADRTSVYPLFGKPDLNQPLNRNGVEKSKIQIPESSRGEIGEVGGGTNDRDSKSTVATTQFPEGFVTQDDSEIAELENGKRDTLAPARQPSSPQKSLLLPNNNNTLNIPTTTKPTEPFRDSNFPFPKSDNLTHAGRGSTTGGLPGNPKAARGEGAGGKGAGGEGVGGKGVRGSGLPANPRARVRESAVMDDSEGFGGEGERGGRGEIRRPWWLSVSSQVGKAR